MTGLLSYFSITLTGIQLENVFLSDMSNLRTFVNTLTADDNYSLRNSQNLPQPIQMQLSKKQKDFSQVFARFLKYISNFQRIYEITNYERRG